jgi:hypothetical protein
VWHDSIKKNSSSLASRGAENSIEQSDGQTDRRTDGRTDGRTETGDDKRIPTLWVTLKMRHYDYTQLRRVRA